MAPRPDNCPVDTTHDCPADAVPSKPVHIVSDSPRKLHTDDMETIEGHLGLVLSRIEDISKAALTSADIAQAMRDGFVATLHDPATWTAAAKGVREAAKREAGNIVMSAVANLMQKVVMFGLAGLLVYWIGGWAAIASLWHAVFGGKP